jgi:SAM-dependent methyltransferase
MGASREGWSDRPAPSAWEQAYLRFETPEEEIRKFRKRLETFGARAWSRHARIVELFCGRGSGLLALNALGFTHLEGIDYSTALVARYAGPGRVVVGDCRHLPYANHSRDVLIVQGGLHHLLDMPRDLELVLREAVRVLVPGGLFVVVEPRNTLFLRAVHAACGRPFLRRRWAKLDALATMIEHERPTYERWLAMPDEIDARLAACFDVVHRQAGWGKLMFVGRSRGV